MGTQTVTTGQLENAQRVTIGEVLFTMEHNAPCANLIRHFTMKQGEKTKTIPKVGQMTSSDLVDGVDIVDSEDIGMTTTDLTSTEKGLKVILTDKLVRQEDADVFRMVGHQTGDAMARQKDEKIIALFTALNGGTTLGLAAKEMSLLNYSACIARMENAKAPRPWFGIHHPYAVYALMSSMSVTPGSTYGFPTGYSEKLLHDFFGITINRVPLFHDGNIALDASDDGIGCIASKEAMCSINEKGVNTERERDASLRATELVVTADYGVFELDDGYGFPMTYDCTVSTSA